MKLLLLTLLFQVDYCDPEFNVYAYWDLENCYEEVEPVSELSPYDPDYPLPFERWYEGFGRLIKSIDKNQAVDHYKACRRYVGDLLGEE